MMTTNKNMYQFIHAHHVKLCNITLYTSLCYIEPIKLVETSQLDPNVEFNTNLSTCQILKMHLGDITLDTSRNRILLRSYDLSVFTHFV